MRIQTRRKVALTKFNVNRSACMQVLVLGAVFEFMCFVLHEGISII